MSQSYSLALFYRCLSSLFGSGVLITRALKVLADQFEDVKMAEVCRSLDRLIRSGTPLSAAMARHPEVFTNVQVKLVQVGERTGALEHIFRRLAAYEETRRDTLMQVKSVMVYPAFMMAICSVMLIVGPAFLFQGLFQLLSSLGAEPPLVTRLLIGVSNLFHQAWFLILLTLAVVGGGRGATLAWREDKYRHRVLGWVERLPLFGEAMHVFVVTRFARCLELQMQAGVSPLVAIPLAAEATDHPTVLAAVERCLNRLRDGGSVAQSLETMNYFPNNFLQMVRIGEETGNLGPLLSDLCRIYDLQLELALSTFTSMLEPLVMLMTGGMVALMVGATMLPIMKVISTL